MPKRSKSKTFHQIISDISSLNDAGKRRVLAHLKKYMSSDELSVDRFVETLRDKRFRKGFACPHCDSKKVVRNGTQRGRQSYKCRACSKYFSDHTHTPFRGTHYPEKWMPFMEHMVNGYSLRKSAMLLGVAASTVFQWRHKVLIALKRLEATGFEGIMEVDETFFLYSEKGNKNLKRDPRKRGGSSKYRGISHEQVCVVVARDRNKETLAKVACTGPITKKQAKVILDGLLDDVSTVCSDANATWRFLAGDNSIDHVELNASKKQRVKKRIYHIQNVNAFHSRLKGWIERFRGVASKYLDNYLIWHRFIEQHSMEAMPAKKFELLLSACLPISPERYLDVKNTHFVLP